MNEAPPAFVPERTDYSHLTFTWKVISIKVKDEVNADGVVLPRAVCQVSWQKTGTDSAGNSGMFNGVSSLTASEVSEGDFVAFENLDEPTVISWVQADLTDVSDCRANEVIQRQIDQSSVSDAAMPWAENE